MGINTVILTLKNAVHNGEFYLTAALTVVHKHKNGGKLAYIFGQGTDEICRRLLALLTPFNPGMLTTDNQLYQSDSAG